MKFSKVGEHTIRCIISEEEISDLGYSLDDLLQNKGRSQDFMNEIFDMAEQELGMTFEKGIKTVRAEFMPDHTLCLSFSEKKEPEGAMDHLLNIVNGLLNTVKEKKEELEKVEKEEDEDNPLAVLILFATLKQASSFAKVVPQSMYVPSVLYKEDELFYLLLDLSEASDEQVKCLSNLTDEFAIDFETGETRMCYIIEHGKPICKKEALQMLAQL